MLYKAKEPFPDSVQRICKKAMKVDGNKLMSWIIRNFGKEKPNNNTLI